MFSAKKVIFHVTRLYKDQGSRSNFSLGFVKCVRSLAKIWVLVRYCIQYIPYRCARSWPVQPFECLYARFLCSRAHSAYAAARPSARATIGYLVYNLSARTSKSLLQTRLYARYLCSRDALSRPGQARRVTIGYIVYNKPG